ncbi:MAG: zinc-dependent dehydrogenase [Candidatus Thermoplasmatota archaeon]
MKTMDVAMYYTNHDVRIEHMPVPTISENELLVKVIASGICGSDVMEWYRIKKAPRVLGHEIAGDIVEVGNNVEQYKVGDRVFVSHHVPCNTCRFCLQDQHTLCHTLHTTNFYPGGFAQFVRVPEINVDRGVFVLPQSMSYEEGVFVEPLACVLRGLRRAVIQPGDIVVIIGSGISGLLHVKCAQLWHAGMIIATDVDPFRLKTAQQMGAHAVFHASDISVEKLQKVTGGRRADVVIVCAGVQSAVRQAFDLVAPGGTVLFFAMTPPGVEVPFPLFELWDKQVRLVSTYAGSPRDIHEAIQLLASKKITVDDMITHRLPLSEAGRGFQLVAQAKDSIKVILEPWKKK